LRVLALDVGEKRIGVALGDPTGLLASPLTTISRTGESADVDEVLRLARQHEVSEIIVGLPLSMSGAVGPQAKLVSGFTDVLADRVDVPVKSVDERLSTVEAERLLRESGVKPSRDRARVDAAAAAVILQSYLDSKRR
jgi:putative Holliday junction resolvase